MSWYRNASDGKWHWGQKVIPVENAGAFTRWFNWNSLSLRLRWWFHLRANPDRPWTYDQWLTVVKGWCKPFGDVMLGLLLMEPVVAIRTWLEGVA